MNLTLTLSKLTPLQKKLIGGTLTALVGFWGGIKFCDVRIKAQIGDYTIQIQKLQKTINERDKDIAGHIATKEEKIKEAEQAKADADQANVVADQAVARFRMLEAQTKNMSAAIGSLPKSVEPPTIIQVEDACEEVIAKKEVVIKGLNTSLTNCFDAKAEADKAIAELNANRIDTDKQLELKDKISNDLSKELESQKRRKWLYLIGGVIAGIAADHAIKK